MKWKSIVLILITLFLISKGIWIIALPILSYILYSSIIATRYWQRMVRSIVFIVPVLFILLGIIAFIEHGYFSPFFFIIIGMLMLYRDEIAQLIMRNVKSVEDSILIRNRFIPFYWLCIMEVRSASIDPYIISNLDGKLIITMGEEKGIFIVFNLFSFTIGRAEEKVIGRAEELAKGLKKSLTYLLPLDSKDAVRLARRGGCKCKLEAIDKLRYADYDAISIKISNGVVVSLSTYKESKSNDDSYFLTEPARLKGRKPFIHELIGTIKERLEFKVDDYTSFISTIAISKGEPFGQRIRDVARSNDDDMLIVKCVTGQTVSMSRAQLRAIMKIYS